MAKRRRHEFFIAVVFDKPLSAAHALGEVKDCIHGEFYTESSEHDAARFRVSSFKQARGAGRR